MKKLLVMGLLASSTVMAHPGGLDDNGGHFNRKTGEYHCHTDACLIGHTEPMKDEENVAYDSGMIPEYNRKEWKHWSDLDKDCQDTRAETLIKASIIPATFKGNKSQCEVVSGYFYDKYTDRYFTSDDDLDVDHIVPLKESHITGGYKWSSEMKELFANDPINVIAVDLSQNRSKSDKWPGLWMPKNTNYHCEYLTQWIMVKEKYGLDIRKQTIEMKESSCN